METDNATKEYFEPFYIQTVDANTKTLFLYYQNAYVGIFNMVNFMNIFVCYPVKLDIPFTEYLMERILMYLIQCIKTLTPNVNIANAIGYKLYFYMNGVVSKMKFDKSTIVNQTLFAHPIPTLQENIFTFGFNQNYEVNLKGFVGNMLWKF